MHSGCRCIVVANVREQHTRPQDTQAQSKHRVPESGDLKACGRKMIRIKSPEYKTWIVYSWVIPVSDNDDGAADGNGDRDAAPGETSFV